MDPSINNRASEFEALSRSSSAPASATREFIVLAKYFAGEYSAEEAAQVRAWIGADPERQRLAEHAQHIWSEAGAARMQWDTDRIWSELQQRRNVSEVTPQRIPVKARTRRLYAGAMTLAVCGLIAIGLVSLERNADQSVSVTESGEFTSGRLFATRRGQRSIVRLPDGAEVMLAAESQLRISSNYGETHRNVYLEGTAQFSVQHDAKKPFVVHTRFGETRDLATTFIVTAYPADSVQRIVVTEGRVASVALHGDRETVVLNPGDMATVRYDGASLVKQGIDVQPYTAWTTGELRFTETPLKDVITELERWYDVTIDITDSRLKSIPLTVSVGKGTIDDALRVIERILDVRFVRNESHISLFMEPAA